MPFPTTAVLTNFTGTNGTSPPSSDWTEPWFSGDGGLQIQSNAATSDNSSFGDSYWDTSTFGPDTEAYVTIATAVSAGEDVYVGARIANPGGAGLDGYHVEYIERAGTDDLYFFRYDDNVGTQLGATVSQEFDSGDALGIEIIGTTITAYRKPSGGSWGALTTRTDATYGSAGYIGLGCQNTTARLDDFGGGTVVAGAAAKARGFMTPMGVW